MIDDRLTFHTINPVLDNIISSISKFDIVKYSNDVDLANNIIKSILNKDEIDDILKLFSGVSVSENEKCVILGYFLAKTINNSKIKDIFGHINWLHHILSCSDYVLQSYFYYINVFLEDNYFLELYIAQMKEYFKYCNLHPDELYLASRFNKKNAIEILNEWNNVAEYSKVINGEWKNFYDCLFYDNSYYFIKPLIETKRYKLIVGLLLSIENFFILDNIFSYRNIEYDLDFMLELLNEFKEECSKYNTLKFLIIHKIQNYLTCLFQRVENCSTEIENKLFSIFSAVNNQFDKYIIYKHWLKALTNQIIKNNEIDLSIMLIEAISKQLINNNFIDELKKELLNNKTSPYENLMLLILIDDSSDFNHTHFELLKEYLLDAKQYIYVNLSQVNKAFEPRFYYLSQLFIGKTIGVNEWNDLWKLLQKERKEAMYPYFYKKNSTSMYRSVFLIIIGIAAIQYICKENTAKASEFLNCIWDAIKEIYLFHSKFYNDFVAEVIFRLAILSNMLEEDYVKYLDFIKFNPAILTQVLASLQLNGCNLDFLKNNSEYIESVGIYVEQLSSKENVSQEYISLCKKLLSELKPV